MKIGNYQTLEKLGENKYGAVYVGERRDSGETVLLRVVRAVTRNETDLVRFRHEFERRRELRDQRIISLLDLVTQDDLMGLVSEGVEEIALQTVFRNLKGGLDLQTFLDFSINLAQSLETLHAQDIIHGAIKPKDIFFNTETNFIRLTNWGIACLLTRECQDIYDPEVMRNSLVYFSPEQTGRMNRKVDTRSDLYSMGVVLYEALVGTPPFVSEDPLELIHAHIAKEARPISEIKPTVPQQISRIISKLLAKSAEERYQSGFGVLNDLQECQAQLVAQNRIDAFELGSVDTSEKFTIPEVIVGREQEMDALMTSFEKATLGPKQFVLISGRPGIGKSALIHEIQKPLVKERGYFIAGKYQQFGGDLPFSAIIQAFENLFNQIVSERDEMVASWRTALLRALGPNGQVITQMIPALETIIGKQPDVPELDGEQAQNRFHLVFSQMLKVIATRERPLVIFLDDLQWSDAASLKLLRVLVADTTIEHLLLIGSYRDNEVGQAHILTSYIGEIEKAGVPIIPIALSPLDEASINKFITLLLKNEEGQNFELAKLTFKKTNGNPFFVRQFLKTLHEEQLLTFDRISAKWAWDIRKIDQMNVTDNVVELMAKKITQLDQKGQDVLKVSSVIGTKFDLTILSTMLEATPQETHRQITALIEEGFFDITGSLYRFRHDRIREAAHTLLSEEQRVDLHRRIGQYLFEKSTDEDRNEILFTIVNHFNFAIDILESTERKLELAELNYRAGLRAKSSAAYDTALTYFRAGIRLLGDSGFEEQGKLMLDLHTEAAEAAFLCTDQEAMDSYCQAAAAHARDLLDKIRIYDIQIQAYSGWANLLDSIRLAKEALALLGIHYPKKTTSLSVIGQLLKTKIALRGKEVEELVNLPLMEDPYKLAAMRIMLRLSTAAYFVSSELFAYNGLKSLLYSLEHGNAPESVPAYGLYSIILCGKLGKYDEGYRFGKMALELSKKFDSKRHRARALFQFNSFVRHWKEDVHLVFDSLAESFRTALEVGDTEIASYPAFVYCFCLQIAGSELGKALKESDYYMRMLKQMGMETSLRQVLMQMQVFDKLHRIQNEPTLLSGKYMDWDNFQQFFVEKNQNTGIFSLYIYQAYLAYLYDDMDKALDNTRMLMRYEEHGRSVAMLHHVYQMYTLVNLRAYSMLRGAEKKEALATVQSTYKKLKKLSVHCPDNFSHRVHMVEGEMARVFGRFPEAIESYNLAIQQARAKSFTNDEALTLELFGRFWREQKNDDLAQFYLGRALQAYRRWGAFGKVEQLVEAYPEYNLAAKQVAAANVERAAEQPDDGKTVQGPGIGESLDMQSVIKASQAISSEIELSKVLPALMNVVIENAGAASGSLILDVEGKLMVEAHVSLEREKRVQLSSIVVDDFKEASALIIRYVQRKRETVVLGDAVNEGPFVNDPYIVSREPRSILCMPIDYRGTFSGIIYLENRKAKDVFTEERVELLRVLSAQAAISIDNAKLYSRIKKSTVLLESALVEANESARVKTEFLARTSHELRTPLNAIINLPEVILERYQKVTVARCGNCTQVFELEPDETVDKDTQCPQCKASGCLEVEVHGEYTGEMAEIFQYLESINTAGKNLLGIVNDLLDISQLEAGALEMVSQPVLIAEVLEEVIGDHEGRAKKRGVDLQAQNLPTGWELYGDPDKLRQVFSAILGNAIKFSEEGSRVEIGTVVSDEEILVSIRDYGVGIEPRHLESIFESFSQVTAGSTRRFGGAGLGLAIARHLVELHGGQIWAESELGKGSVFHVKLPKGRVDFAQTPVITESSSETILS